MSLEICERDLTQGNIQFSFTLTREEYGRGFGSEFRLKEGSQVEWCVVVDIYIQ